VKHVEQRTGKGAFKWRKSAFDTRLAYLQELLDTSLLKDKIFFARYTNAKAYLDLTIYTTAKAILKRVMGSYRATVWVDGLDKQEARRFERGLRGLKIKVRKVRGLREENDPLIRLADAIAGFLRDVLEGQTYGQSLYQDALRRGILREV
jgi:hypothetical protein